MSTDNLENTEPIKKRTRSTQPVEDLSTNADAQAETRVVRWKSRGSKADQNRSVDEFSAIPENSANDQNTSSLGDLAPGTSTPPSVDELPDPAAKINRSKWIWLGVLMVLVMVLAGSGIGYASAMRAREVEQNNQRLILATTQYELGLVDQEHGNLGSAKNRFEYVLSIYPEFPGIEAKLVEVGFMIAQNDGELIIPTVGPEPTPTVAITVVPTKSTSSTTLLYNQARAQLEGQDWEGLYTTLSAMREIDPAYKAMEVDGMWYITLRNRGIRLIQGGQLEPGLYNFALAEQFAPIDADAESYRTWARMYINAGSHWMINWYAAVEGFASLYSLVPQLRDSSGITVTQRYTRALTGYGDFLQASYDFCNAAASYRQAASVLTEAGISEKITQADEYCANPPATPTPTEDPSTPTETPAP
jgi:tetratricopeptide (TPR) repeat protein